MQFRSRPLRVLAAAAWVVALAAPAFAQISSEFPTKNAAPGSTRGTDVAFDPVAKVYALVGAYGCARLTFANENLGQGLLPWIRHIRGRLVGHWRLRRPATFAHYPRVAYSPDISNVGGSGITGGFLVTWHQNDGPGGGNVVHGRLAQYANNTAYVSADRILSPIEAGNTWWEAGAAVAYSRTSHVFLIAWQAGVGNVQTARVGLDGRTIGATYNAGLPSGGSTQISPGYGREPGVAWNPVTDEFGVAYSGEDTVSPTSNFARVRASDGVLLRRNPFSHAGAAWISDVQYNPATGNYLMTWFQAPGGTTAAEISASGDVIAMGPATTTVGSYDGLGIGYNGVTNTFLIVGHHSSSEVGAAELNQHGVRNSAEGPVSSKRRAQGLLSAAARLETPPGRTRDWDTSPSPARLAAIFEQLVLVDV